MTHDLTDNEFKLIEKIREMKPREKLVVVKQKPEDKQEYVVFVESVLLIGRALDK